jgi:hypothetical protein
MVEYKGKSLRPLVEKNIPKKFRSLLRVEGEFGNMIVTDRYKYMLYDEGENKEQLIDLKNNPGEMRNDADNLEYTEELNRLRKLYLETYS